MKMEGGPERCWLLAMSFAVEEDEGQLFGDSNEPMKVKERGGAEVGLSILYGAVLSPIGWGCHVSPQSDVSC